MNKGELFFPPNYRILNQSIVECKYNEEQGVQGDSPAF